MSGWLTKLRPTFERPDLEEPPPERREVIVSRRRMCKIYEVFEGVFDNELVVCFAVVLDES